MKIQKHKAFRGGFTLIELITVVSVIVILFSLVIGGYSFADRSSKRSRTEITIKAVRSGLELYKEKFGSYPMVNNDEQNVMIADASYSVGGGACLYQALSGDGYDQIMISDSSSVPESAPESNGNIEDAEAPNVVMTDMPREIWVVSDGIYYIADGFGHPIRYNRAAPTQAAQPGQDPPRPTTVNLSSYDIWSYADDTENITMDSLQGSESLKDQKWIKNW